LEVCTIKHYKNSQLLTYLVTYNNKNSLLSVIFKGSTQYVGSRQDAGDIQDAFASQDVSVTYLFVSLFLWCVNCVAIDRAVQYSIVILSMKVPQGILNWWHSLKGSPWTKIFGLTCTPNYIEAININHESAYGIKSLIDNVQVLSIDCHVSNKYRSLVCISEQKWMWGIME